MNKNKYLILFILVIGTALSILAACSCGGNKQPTEPVTTDSGVNEEETIDPDELSEYVDNYVIDVQEDESFTIH
ncbi:MAG: hypothetical protein IKF90_01040 [Parasporobacterium sp.]|nr:hypothetical protein [Parasporobacterium sp.]